MTTTNAYNILINTYWNSQGWIPKENQYTSIEDFRFAKSEGVMFDPVRLTHSEIVQRAKEASGRIDPEIVSDAFLSSFSSGRFDQRSALGSYAVLRHFPNHDFTLPPHSVSAMNCYICNKPASGFYQDLNVFNFERFKWGGLRHLNIHYAVFDLEQFLKNGRLKPTKKDVLLFQDLIRQIEDVPETATAEHLPNLISDRIESDRVRLLILIDILGYTGIVRVENHSGFFNRYVTAGERMRYNHDYLNYPSFLWKGCDGINREALDYFFPQLDFH